MSQPPKEKKKQFMLPSALRQLQQHKQAETQQFIKDLDSEHKSEKFKKEAKHHSLFKLNLESSAIISEVPVDTLRKRSKSQKCESLQSEQKEVFSLLDHYRQIQEKQMKQKASHLKKYENIDLRQLTQTSGRLAPQRMQSEEEEDKYEIVKPSQTYHIESQKEDSFFQPMIFQTPILPCFASEFQPRIDGSSKHIREGQGVWRVGKMKIKGGKCQLRIGEFLFEGSRAAAEGKAGVISGSSMFMLPKWREMCILQPHESLFE